MTVTQQKRRDVEQAVELLWILLSKGISARDILTLKSFENAITVVWSRPASWPVYTGDMWHVPRLRHLNI